MTSWMCDEPGMRTLRWQSARLLRRARRRTWLLLAASLLVTLAALGVTARRKPLQKVSAVLRITETNREIADRSDWNNRALRGYVTEVAFSNAALLEIIQRRKLFRTKDGRFEPTAALTELREMVAVEVVQNHVISLLEPGERPRSAHIYITVTDSDRDDALMLAQDLAALVAATGLNQRRQQARVDLEATEAAIAQAREVLAKRRAEAVRIAGLVHTNPVAASQFAALQHALKVGQARLAVLEKERISIGSRVATTNDTGGLDIEVLDPVVPPPPMPRSQRLLVAGVAAGIVSLPIVALLLGALSRRVHDEDDLRHLGIACLARVPGSAPRRG